MKFDLKTQVNMVAFLHTIDSCTGDVLFESADGDLLNLKSQLSKYLFLTVAPDPKYLEHSKISCTEQDAVKLSNYIVIP